MIRPSNAEGWRFDIGLITGPAQTFRIPQNFSASPRFAFKLAFERSIEDFGVGKRSGENFGPFNEGENLFA